jgi:hypothetical protein
MYRYIPVYTMWSGFQMSAGPPVARRRRRRRRRRRPRRELHRDDSDSDLSLARVPPACSHESRGRLPVAQVRPVAAAMAVAARCAIQVWRAGDSAPTRMIRIRGRKPHSGWAAAPLGPGQAASATRITGTTGLGPRLPAAAGAAAGASLSHRDGRHCDRDSGSLAGTGRLASHWHGHCQAV